MMGNSSMKTSPQSVHHVQANDTRREEVGWGLVATSRVYLQ
jgi:hypothetical protein